MAERKSKIAGMREGIGGRVEQGLVGWSFGEVVTSGHGSITDTRIKWLSEGGMRARR